MTNIYKISLKNILNLCKIIGIINMSYILDSDGLIIQSTETIYKFLEISRMIMLIIFTYSLYKNDLYFEEMYLFKFWYVIIASRISEIPVIQ